MIRLKFVFALMALAAVLSWTAPLANAQNFHASFDLPFETHWGPAVLEPGEYTVTLEHSAAGTVFVHINGKNTVATILAGPADQSTNSARLTLVNVNGTYAVQKFDSGALGISYEFTVPKGVRTRTEAMVSLR